MKLASLKDGSRDGKLVIVSRDLTRCTDASFLTATLQAALDNWHRISPHLSALAESLEVGAVPEMRFHEHDAHAPLPRAFQHVGCGDFFVGPRDGVTVGGANIQASAAGAIIVTDVGLGEEIGAGRDAVALVLLSAVLSNADGEAIGAGFSPVAVTPDELGGEWNAGIVWPIQVSVDGKQADVTTPSVDFGGLIAKASKTRPLSAGAILVAPGAPVTLQTGDVLRVEMKDRAGHSIFGAIEQTLAAAE